MVPSARVHSRLASLQESGFRSVSCQHAPEVLQIEKISVTHPSFSPPLSSILLSPSPYMAL